MTKTLSERTGQILADMGLNQSELAALANVTKGAVHQWLKSKPTATMDPEVAFCLSEKTGYSPKWLILGAGPEKVSAEVAWDAYSSASEGVKAVVDFLLAENATMGDWIDLEALGHKAALKEKAQKWFAARDERKKKKTLAA